MAACAHNPRDFAVVQLLLQTGIKLSELTQLALSDVELLSVRSLEKKDVGYLHIRGSERQKARILPLNRKACLALNLYLKERITQKTNSVLFVSRFGTQLGARGVEKIIDKYLRSVGISDASVQSLRHTFGAYHAAMGASIKTLQEAMGYKDKRSTMIYISLSGEIRKQMRNNAL